MILWQALVVFVILFAVILVIGLLSYRFLAGGEESAEDEMSEWGLGGRRFGTIITWFLVGRRPSYTSGILGILASLCIVSLCNG